MQKKKQTQKNIKPSPGMPEQNRESHVAGPQVREGLWINLNTFFFENFSTTWIKGK